MRKQALAMVTAIVRRDLTVVRRSRAVMFPIVILPVILFVALPALVAVGLRLGQDQLAELVPLLEAMPETMRRQLGGGTTEQQLLVYLFEYQFATFFLIIPLMVAAVIAADSFAGEKERKTLEALLYTPTTDLELYVAKLIGPWLAAMAVAVGGVVLYAVSVNLAAGDAAGRLLIVGPLWLVVVFWLSPAVAALALGVLVQVSARVRGFQEAYQLGGVVVLPVIALLAAQFAGVLFVDMLLALVLGGVVWLTAGVVLWVGYRTFRRERLLLAA
jgi:ABC-2 type transport system permease protein